MMKKKKQSRSQSSSKKTSPDSSPSPSASPRLLSLFRSKSKDLKHMLGMKSKTVPGLSSQSRIVRCPKCKKLLQEPIDATCYKCGGCDSILQAKRWELQGNDNTIPEALLSSQNRSLSTEVESAEDGRNTPMRNTHWEYNSRESQTHREKSRPSYTHSEYNSRAPPSVERDYDSETVYKHATSDIRREWMRRANEFSGTDDSDVYASERSSPYNSHSHEGRYQDPPRVPFYPASRSPSSAYEYGYSNSFQGSQVSASEQSYYHQQPNQFKQYGREGPEGSFQESSIASPIHYPGETSDGKYYHCSSQSQNHYLYEHSSAATPHRSVYSERSYQAAAAPHRYTYSEHYMGNSKSETSSEKSSDRDKNRYVRERNPVVKRHVLPSAGGAPFAICSYCLELLELPQVSLNKHKRYQVRCGSCSGVLKLSTHDNADTVLDSPSFVDSGMGFTDETVAIHQHDQASASEGHEEIYPDETHMSCSDNDSGDTICKSINDVILSRSLETFEDRQSILSEILDSQLEPLQTKLKPSVNHKFREQQLASSETIKETSMVHLEQSQEAHSEKITGMGKTISERGGNDFEESRYEKNEILKPEEMVGDGSGESLEVTVYRNNDTSRSSEKAETVAERPVSLSVGPLNKKEYICGTRVLSETTMDTQELGWKDIQENEEYGGEATWKEIMGNKPGSHLEKSQYSEDSICDSTSSYGETFEDTTVKEDTEHISNTFSNAMSTKPQSPLTSLVNESQRLIGHPDDSGEATVTIFKIHGEQIQDCIPEQPQYKYENLSEKQELDKTISDRVRYEVEESRYETNAGEDVSGVSLEKSSETFKTIEEDDTSEGRSASHQMDPPKENVEDSYETVEPVYLHGSGYAGERAWEETMRDRAGLHLEEYERNYEDHTTPIELTSGRAPTSHMHESELREILEPEEDADGRSESSSRGSFNDHESSEVNSVFNEPQDAKQEQLLYEYENSSERQELSSPDSEIVRSELQDCSYETNEMLEPDKMDGVGFDVSLEKVSETIIGETGKERSVVHQMEPQNENVENSYVEPAYLEGEGNASERTWGETKGDESGLQLEDHESNPYPFGWISERAPTFRLRDYEQGTIPELAENAEVRSESSSRSSFSDQEISKLIAVLQEEESWVVNDTKTALQIREMVEDENSLHVEKRENESMKLGESFDWTSERALTFRLREDEPRTMLERDDDDDRRSESSSRGSLNDHTSSKERVMSHEEEHLPGVTTKDGHELHLEKGENGTVDLNKALEPKDDIFRLCPNDTFGQERMMFHLEMSEETQAKTKCVSSKGHESPRKMPELDTDSEEEIMGDHLEHFQKDNEKSGQTSEPYPHLHITSEPSEIVGLRHALYQTHTSPLRSPLTSPIHTPIGSPLHYLMSLQTRSPIHSHIVSPLRSPINSSGSLSDVLFFGKKS